MGKSLKPALCLVVLLRLSNWFICMILLTRHYVLPALFRREMKENFENPKNEKCLEKENVEARHIYRMYNTQYYAFSFKFSSYHTYNIMYRQEEFDGLKSKMALSCSPIVFSGKLFHLLFLSLFCNSIHITAAKTKFYVIPAYNALGLPATPAANVRRVMVTVGSSKQTQGIYQNTIDTGSGLLDIKCNTPKTNSHVKDAYTWYNTTSLNLTPEQCRAQHTGNCYVGNSCWFSTKLTNGTFFSGYAGPFARDTVTFPGASPALTVDQAIFGCSESFKACIGTSKECNSFNKCPPSHLPPQKPSQPFRYGAPARGVEFGFTFSAPSIPSQLVTRGVIDKAIALCYIQSPTTTSCNADNVLNSYVVMGKAPGPSSYITTVPLAIVPPHAGSTPSATTLPTALFRSVLVAATVPVFGSSDVASFEFSVDDKGKERSKPKTVLWDSGAGGKMAVPKTVYQAYLDYFDAALKQFNSTGDYAGKFSVCPAKKHCGGNFDVTHGKQGRAACISLSVDLKDDGAIKAATKALTQLYPSSIDFFLKNGTGAVSLPTVTPVYNCKESRINMCSFISPGAPWIATPWFTGKWVEFDLTQSPAGLPWANGVMRVASVDSCEFLSK